MADRIVDAAEQGMQGFLGDQYTGAHTKRLIKAAITAFDGFLIQKGIQRDVISKLSTAEVNDLLRTFYSEMKKADGERYAKKSMISLRYGLQKYFLKLRKEDIVTDKKFSSSNAVFKALIKKLEADGIGETKQKIPICPQDIAKLYSTVFNTDTPQGLQNKTMFEYLYYFCKRKRQSLRELTKGDFIICVDSAGREFVTVRERPTQNSIRGNGGDPGSSKQTRMYDRPGDPSCPVTSFKKYISKLHPDNPNFWQRAKKRVRDSDEQWYDKASLGKNTLNSFMSSLSEEAGLSQRYTNHCIKTTSVAVLDNQAVDVTSHNSRLEDQRKREMSDILCQNIPSISATTGFPNIAASSTPTHTNSWSGKDDHFTGMNEYRNLLVGDAASAWKRLIGRFYWLNDSDIAKHLIEVHEIHCQGSCPLERTQDTPNSGSAISSKQQVLDLMPSTDTHTGNKDILLQLEVDEGAESIDEDSSDDSDLQGDEDFDIKQEQLSEDDSPPTSPGSTLPRTRQTAPSTSIHTNNPGGDNFALTEVKLEPVETFSSNFPLGNFTADKSRPQKDPVLTNTDYSLPLPPSSHSSVTSNTAPTRPFIPMIIQKAMQESDRTGTGAPRTAPSSVNFVYPLLNTVTSSVKQVHPTSSQNSAVAQNINPVTLPANIIRAQLPLTVNTPASGNAVNLPQSIPYFTIQRGNALYLQQAPAPQALQQTTNPHVLPRLQVLQQDTRPHVVQQTTTTHVQQATTPHVQQTTIPHVQQTTIPHVQQTTIPHVVQQATTPHVEQGTNPHVVQQVIIPRVVQQAPTPQSLAQTFSNFVNPLTTSLSPLGGADLQSESPASQGFPTVTTPGHCLPVEDNLTGRDSVKRPLSDSDEGPGTSKRLITVKEETDSETIGEPV